MTLWQEIAAQIGKATGKPFTPKTQSPVSGGCINTAYQLSHQEQHYFVKLNHAQNLAMFAAEAAGLSEIARSHTLRVPTPLCYGRHENQAFLVMEFITLGPPKQGSMAKAGEQLAAMHRSLQSHHGWQQERHRFFLLQA